MRINFRRDQLDDEPLSEDWWLWNGNLLFRCSRSPSKSQNSVRFFILRLFQAQFNAIKPRLMSNLLASRDLLLISRIAAFFFARCKQLLWTLCLSFAISQRECVLDFLCHFLSSFARWNEEISKKLSRLRNNLQRSWHLTSALQQSRAPAQLSKKTHYSWVHHSQRSALVATSKSDKGVHSRRLMFSVSLIVTLGRIDD